MRVVFQTGLFALLTANLSAFFIGKEVTGVEREVEEVELEESRILGKLSAIENRLDRIEEKLKNQK